MQILYTSNLNVESDLALTRLMEEKRVASIFDYRRLVRDFSGKFRDRTWGHLSIVLTCGEVLGLNCPVLSASFREDDIAGCNKAGRPASSLLYL